MHGWIISSRKINFAEARNIHRKLVLLTNEPVTYYTSFGDLSLLERGVILVPWHLSRGANHCYCGVCFSIIINNVVLIISWLNMSHITDHKLSSKTTEHVTFAYFSHLYTTHHLYCQKDGIISIYLHPLVTNVSSRLVWKLENYTSMGNVKYWFLTIQLSRSWLPVTLVPVWRIRGDEEGNADYGGMVQPSQQHV